MPLPPVTWSFSMAVSVSYGRRLRRSRPDQPACATSAVQWRLADSKRSAQQAIPDGWRPTRKSLKGWRGHSCLLTYIKPPRNPVSGHTTTGRRLPHPGKRRRYLLDHFCPCIPATKDLSPRPPLLRGEGESNEVLRKHEKGRQECLPHLQTRFRDGSRIQKSHCAAVEMIDSRINQLTGA